MTAQHPAEPAPPLLWWSPSMARVIGDVPTAPLLELYRREHPADAVALGPVAHLTRRQLAAEDRELAALGQVDDLRAELAELRAAAARRQIDPPTTTDQEATR